MIRMTAVVAAALLASGCFMQPETPHVEIHVKPGYNTDTVLIPFYTRAAERSAELRWTLEQRVAAESEFRDSRTLRVSGSSSGIIDLGWREDGRYRLTVEYLSSGDTAEPVPYMTTQREFYIDRNAPDVVHIEVKYSNDGGSTWGELPPAPGANSKVRLSYTGMVNPDLDSPVGLAYTLTRRTTDETLPPVPFDGYAKGAIEEGLWSATDPSAYAKFIVVAVDAAGNRSAPVIREWSF